MTEYAIYLIGRSLGVTVADARIAIYRGRLRFMSKYFLDRRKPEELIHGMQLFNELYDENTVTAVLGNELGEQMMFSVQAVKAAFGAHYLDYGAHVEDQLFDGFVSMLTHDAIIGVQDRHHAVRVPDVDRVDVKRKLQELQVGNPDPADLLRLFGRHVVSSPGFELLPAA